MQIEDKLEEEKDERGHVCVQHHRRSPQNKPNNADHLKHMELRIFDDDFLDQQLKEIDQRTKALLKIDTSSVTEAQKPIKKSTLAHIPKP